MKKTSYQLEPTTAAFIEQLEKSGAPPIYKLAPIEARKVLENLQAQPIEKLPAEIQDSTIQGPNGAISIRIVRPPKENSPLPVIMYFHGGGWILGSKDTHDRLLRDLAHATDAAVVFVNFTPSPEAHYPAAIEEAYAATAYIAKHGKEYNLNSHHLAIAGDSVGGNMAAVVALLAKERGGPKIDYQVLFYPVTDGSMSSASYKEFAEGPWLTRKAMEWFWDAYEPNKEKRKLPTASPLHATVEQLKNLPPALIITDENDVLRDEGEAYAHKLMQAGVQVTAVRYLGTCHDFLLLNPLSQTPAPKSAIALAGLHLKKAFNSK